MIWYTYVIEDRQYRSKHARKNAVSFNFFFEKFDNVAIMSVLLTTETDNTIIFQQNKFHI